MIRVSFTRLIPAMLVALAAGLPAMALTPQKHEKKPSWGYVDDSGKWVVKPKYETAADFELMPNGRKLSRVTQKGLTGFVDEKGQLLKPGIVFESVEPLGEQTALVKVKGKTGVINYDCEYIIEPKIASLSPIDDGAAYIAVFNGKTGLFDRDGKWLISPLYTKIEADRDDYLFVYSKDKAGVFTRAGEMKLEPKEYTKAEPDGRYWKVWKNDKAGIYDPEMKSLCSKVDYADVLQPAVINGIMYIPAKKKDKWGVICNDKEVVKFRNSSMTYLPDTECFFMLRDKIGGRLWSPVYKVFLEVDIADISNLGPFHSISGNIDRPTGAAPDRIYNNLKFGERYDYGTDNPKSAQINFANKHFPDYKVGVLTDKEGNILSSNATSVSPIGNFYFIGGTSGKVYSQTGELIAGGLNGDMIPTRLGEYYLLGNKALHSNGKLYPLRGNGTNAMISKEDGKYYFISPDAHMKKGFDKVENMPNSSEYLNVCSDGRWGVLSNGRELVACIAAEPLIYDADMKGFIIREGNKKGFINSEGKTIFPAQYDNIQAVGAESYMLGSNGKWGIADASGRITLPIEYENLEPIEGEFEGMYRVRKNNLLGLVVNNELTLLPEYEKIDENDAGDFWICKNELWGVAGSDGKVILQPVYAGEAILLDGTSCYIVESGKGPTYYDRSGNKLDSTPRITIDSQLVEHNVYVNGNKSLKLWFDFSAYFLKGKPIFMKAVVYNKNGTPAKNKKGEPVSWGTWYTPNYRSSEWSDQWISISNNNFQSKPSSITEYYKSFRPTTRTNDPYALPATTKSHSRCRGRDDSRKNPNSNSSRRRA